MRKSLLCTVSAAVLCSSAALGADLPVKAPSIPVAPPATWTGWYAGLNAGYAWGTADPTLIGSVTVEPFAMTRTTGNPPRLSPRGFIGGGQLGYNSQFGQWLVGGEIDFSGLDVKATATQSPFFIGKGTKDTFAWSSHYDWLFTARARAGYLVAPNWLLYATGGVAVTHVSDSSSCTPVPGNGNCGDFNGLQSIVWSDSKTLVGGTFGGGVETMFAPNWTARFEYLHAAFQHTTPLALPLANNGPVPPLFSFSHDLNIARVAVSYRFAP